MLDISHLPIRKHRLGGMALILHSRADKKKDLITLIDVNS